jgi:hypothetical protein
MFETVIAAMLRHKQIVLAAIVLTALAGYVMPPAVQVAQATSFGEDLASSIIDPLVGGNDDDEEDEEDDNDGVDQELDQEQEQNQEATNNVEQNNDQSERNVQANDLETGDATATVTQSNDADQTVAAESSAAARAAGGESEADGGDGGCDCHKHKKHHGGDGSDGGDASSSADATAIADSVARATGIQDNDNEATVTQDTSIHDVDLSNNVEFGDDTNRQVAIPIIDQDQRQANIAAQLGIDLDIGSGFTVTGFTNTDD